MHGIIKLLYNESMNDNNIQYINMLFGMEYSKSIISKPQFFDWSGNLRIVEVLKDIASEYQQLKDDKLIRELIELKKQAAVVVKDNNKSQFVDCQIKRQMLTNAYALNHGASLGDIKRISVLNKEYREKIAIVFSFILALESIFIKCPSAFSSVDKELRSIMIKNTCLNYLDAKTKAKLERCIWNLYSLRSYYNLRQWTMTLYNQILPPDVSLYLAEILIQHFGKDEFQSFVDDFDSNYNCLCNLVNKFQMPPYGVALAMGFEDEGQRVLPWHGKLSEHTISELRRKMHAEVHGSARGMPTKAYNAIKAAYCNMCFNTMPNVEMAQQEFIDTNLDKGHYSADVTAPLKKYKPFVERGLTAQIGQWVAKEPFYAKYLELKEILEST